MNQTETITNKLRVVKWVIKILLRQLQIPIPIMASPVKINNIITVAIVMLIRVLYYGNAYLLRQKLQLPYKTIRLVSLLQKQVFFEDVFKSTLYAPPFKGKAQLLHRIFF
jgi:hypothetical protein